MKNSKLKIPKKWIVVRDVFYNVDPWNSSISYDLKFDNVFVHADLLLLKLDDYHLDLGWYGGEKNGFFGLYLFKGKDWHNSILLELRRVKNYSTLIETINTIAQNVVIGKYDQLEGDFKSIDDYLHFEEVITIP